MCCWTTLNAMMIKTIHMIRLHIVLIVGTFYALFSFPFSSCCSDCALYLNGNESPSKPPALPDGSYAKKECPLCRRAALSQPYVIQWALHILAEPQAIYYFLTKERLLSFYTWKPVSYNATGPPHTTPQTYSNTFFRFR